jgi:predicted DNA binding CopG/RHH family protein
MDAISAKTTPKMNPLEEKEFLRLQELAESMRKSATREQYSGIRTEREKATFAMMMRMNPEALTAIRKEFLYEKMRLCWKSSFI